MSADQFAGVAAATSAPRASARAITAAVAGTVFEWFDFFLYGSLVAIFGRLFFPTGNATTGLLAALAVFGAGWVVRPVGALVFGRMGDRIGRRKTFLVTIVLMGGATVSIGFLPTYAAVGMLSPILLVTLRLLQGLWPWVASLVARRPMWPSIPVRVDGVSPPVW